MSRAAGAAEAGAERIVVDALPRAACASRSRVEVGTEAAGACRFYERWVAAHCHARAGEASAGRGLSWRG
jgi:hypothetical protein